MCIECACIKFDLIASLKGTLIFQPFVYRTEWDMINIIRDIYGRLVLGQYFLSGGQGPGLQMSRDPLISSRFEQTKAVDQPLQGGGILPNPSDFPRRVLTEIGMSSDEIIALESKLLTKCSAKDQKEALREVLRIVADNTKGQNGVLERAGNDESLLHGKARKAEVTPLPEKLVTYSMMKKKETLQPTDSLDEPWHGNIF